MESSPLNNNGIFLLEILLSISIFLLFISTLFYCFHNISFHYRKLVHQSEQLITAQNCFESILAKQPVTHPQLSTAFYSQNIQKMTLHLDPTHQLELLIYAP